MLEWINSTVAAASPMAGPMSLMANILLSTRRPIINHPHYEDARLRETTKRVYSIFSRRSVSEVHKIMKSLEAEYVVLSSNWCLRGRAWVTLNKWIRRLTLMTMMIQSRGGCGMTDIWDVEEPERRGGDEVCSKLWNEANPKPFKRVFANDDYVILRVWRSNVKITDYFTSFLSHFRRYALHYHSMWPSSG